MLLAVSMSAHNTRQELESGQYTSTDSGGYRSSLSSHEDDIQLCSRDVSRSNRPSRSPERRRLHVRSRSPSLVRQDFVRAAPIHSPRRANALHALDVSNFGDRRTPPHSRSTAPMRSPRRYQDARVTIRSRDRAVSRPSGTYHSPRGSRGKDWHAEGRVSRSRSGSRARSPTQVTRRRPSHRERHHRDDTSRSEWHREDFEKSSKVSSQSSRSLANEARLSRVERYLAEVCHKFPGFASTAPGPVTPVACEEFKGGVSGESRSHVSRRPSSRSPKSSRDKTRTCDPSLPQGEDALNRYCDKSTPQLPACPNFDRTRDWVASSAHTPPPSEATSNPVEEVVDESEYQAMLKVEDLIYLQCKDEIKPRATPTAFPVHPLMDGLGPKTPSRKRPTIPHSFLQRETVLDRLDATVKSLEQGQKKFLSVNKVFDSKEFKGFDSCERQISALSLLTLEERAALNNPRRWGSEEFVSRQHELLLRANDSIQHLSTLMLAIKHLMKGADLSADLDLLLKAAFREVNPLDTWVSSAIANCVLHRRDQVLENANLPAQPKEHLRTLPCFSDRLFPTDVKKVVQDAAPSTLERSVASMETLAAAFQSGKSKAAPQPLTNQTNQTSQKSKSRSRSRGKTSSRGKSNTRGRGRGGRGSNATSTTNTNSKPSQPQDFRQGPTGPSKN